MTPVYAVLTFGPGLKMSKPIVLPGPVPHYELSIMAPITPVETSEGLVSPSIVPLAFEYRGHDIKIGELDCREYVFDPECLAGKKKDVKG
jgi:hypothetical protein